MGTMTQGRLAGHYGMKGAWLGTQAALEGNLRRSMDPVGTDGLGFEDSHGPFPALPVSGFSLRRSPLQK